MEDRRTFLTGAAAFAAAVPVCGLGAGAAADIFLPKADATGGKALMDLLAARKSSRTFADRDIAPEKLSALLWAAGGVNRPDGRRTAPTGRNVQDIDVYAMLRTGVYRYNAAEQKLTLVNAGDFRKEAGPQDFCHTAPVNLFYVQNLDKAMKGDETSTARYGGIHTGAIMQNVYLFCAQEGLSTVARGLIDRAVLNGVLKLGARQSVILGQTVGFAA